MQASEAGTSGTRRVVAGVARRTPGVREVLRLRDDNARLSRAEQRARQQLRATREKLGAARERARKAQAQLDGLRERLRQRTAELNELRDQLREVRNERNTARSGLHQLADAAAWLDGEARAAGPRSVTGLRAQVVAAVFVEVLTHSEDVTAAIVSLAQGRAQLPTHPYRYPLPLMLRALERIDELRPAIHAALAVHGHRAGHTEFARHHLDHCGNEAPRLIPVEFARIRIADDPTAAEDVLDAILRLADPTPDQWLDVLAAVAASRDRATLARAIDAAIGSVRWDEAGKRALGRFAEYAPDADSPSPWTADVVVGVMGYRRPDLRSGSSDLDDYIQTLAALSHVLRRSGLRLVGDRDLVAAAECLRARIRPDLVIDGDDATVALVEVNRDDSALDNIPSGTWFLAFGWHLLPDALGSYGLPYHPNLRPIFLSFHCNRRHMLSDEAIDYLRRYAPIGCRDWYTVDLLTHLGIPAFFTGCVTTTVDAYFADAPDVEDLPEAYVDASAPGDAVAIAHTQEAVRQRPLAQNLRAALASLDDDRANYGSLITERLHSYLSAMSIGIPTRFVPARPFDVSFEGLTDPSADLEGMRKRIRNMLLEPVLTAVFAGAPEDDVYALWRSITEPLVAADVAARATAYEWPETTLDDPGAVAAIQQAAWSRPVPRDRAHAMIDLCVGLDRNYLTQLYTVIDRCLARTERPLRLHALVRGFGAADYERFAGAFPEVDVTFLPCDRMDFGEVSTRASYITDSTMDRLLLPELLGDLDKVLYLDLDLLPFGDIGELYDTAVGDAPLAARQNDRMYAMGGLVGYADVAQDRLATSSDGWRLLNLVHRRTDAADYGFNAGVLVMNLRRMRDDCFLARYAGFIERFGLNGQYALNLYASGSFLPLQRTWNAWPNRDVLDKEGPAILHWLGPLKPWDDVRVAYQDEWRAAVAAMRERRGAPDPE